MGIINNAPEMLKVTFGINWDGTKGHLLGPGGADPFLILHAENTGTNPIYFYEKNGSTAPNATDNRLKLRWTAVSSTNTPHVYPLNPAGTAFEKVISVSMSAGWNGSTGTLDFSKDSGNGAPLNANILGFRFVGGAPASSWSITGTGNDRWYDNTFTSVEIYEAPSTSLQDKTTYIFV